MSKIDELAGNAANAEKESAPFMTPEVKPPKKGAGRPPMSEEEKKKKAELQKAKASQKPTITDGKSDPTKPQPTLQNALGIDGKTIMKPVASWVSNMGESYVGDPRAKMTPDEHEAAAEALGKVAEKYLPEMLDKYGAECMVVIAFGTYGLRLTAMKKALKMEKEASQVNPPTPRPRQEQENVVTMLHDQEPLPPSQTN